MINISNLKKTSLKFTSSLHEYQQTSLKIVSIILIPNKLFYIFAFSNKQNIPS